MSTRLFGTDGVRGVANERAHARARVQPRRGGRALPRRQGRGPHRRRPGHAPQRRHARGRARRRHLLPAAPTRSLAGIVPTPAVALLTRELGADGGVVISASHNPPEYNGIKFFSRDGFKLPDELEDEIEAFVVARARLGAADGRRRRARRALDRRGRALHRARRRHRSRRPRRAHASPSTAGTARRRSPRRRRFGGSAPTSSRSTATGTAWTSTSAAARRTSARSPSSCASGGFDLGIAHDGDADRVLAVDETGDEVDGDMIMAICARAPARSAATLAARHRRLHRDEQPRLRGRDARARHHGRQDEGRRPLRARADADVGRRPRRRAVRATSSSSSTTRPATVS